MITKKELSICVSIGLTIGVVISIGLVILSYPTNCYYEYGKITNEWETDSLYYVKFINRQGQNRTIWLSDKSPDTISPQEAMLSYGGKPKENLILRWCYIPINDKTRIRGAWRW